MFLFLGILMILYFLLINSMSLLTFKYVFLIVGLALAIYQFIRKYIQKNKLYNFLKLTIKVFLVVFISFELMIVFYPKQSTDKCDYIIVLGALVNKYEISKSLQDRLDSCIEYLQKSGDDCKIVVSGGRGRGECISEALAMKNYLASNGVEKDRIIMEDKSSTTRENFVFSKEIIEKTSGKKFENLKIKVVTTDFHTVRSRLISFKEGYKNIDFYTSKSNYYLAVLNYTREFFAILCNIVLNY